jgi:single-stranded DNA-binding protein
MKKNRALLILYMLFFTACSNSVDEKKQVDNYENKDKVKVSKIFITADRVNFLPRFEKTNKEGSETEDQESPAPQKTSKSNTQDSSPVGADDDIPF